MRKKLPGAPHALVLALGNAALVSIILLGASVR